MGNDPGLGSSAPQGCLGDLADYPRDHSESRTCPRLRSWAADLHAVPGVLRRQAGVVPTLVPHVSPRKPVYRRYFQPGVYLLPLAFTITTGFLTP